MVHGNEQKKQIEAAAQLFPAEGMEIELFDLCAGKEQRALAEEMAGADLEIANGRLRITLSSVSDHIAPTWEMTKSFVAGAFRELTEKSEEWAGRDHSETKVTETGIEDFSFSALSAAITEAEETSRITCDEALIQMAKSFREENMPHEAELSGALKLQGMALQILLRSISENGKRKISQSNKRMFHETTGYQLCTVLENAASLPDIPVLYRYCLYETLTEYYLRIDFGIQALKNAILQMGVADSSGIPYWRKVYANKLLLAAYKAVRTGNDDITAQEYAGIYQLSSAAKAIMAQNPSDDGQ